MTLGQAGEGVAGSNGIKPLPYYAWRQEGLLRNGFVFVMIHEKISP